MVKIVCGFVEVWWRCGGNVPPSPLTRLIQKWKGPVPLQVVAWQLSICAFQNQQARNEQCGDIKYSIIMRPKHKLLYI